MAKEPSKNRVQPKSQEEILHDTGRKSYVTGDDVPLSQENRAYQTTREDDKVKDFAVTLEDIDTSVLIYIKNNIKPTILQNGNQIQIPVTYATQEMWKSVQADGYYRDLKGKLQIPLIILKRDSVEKNRSITNKLDGNKAHNYSIWAKKYSSKNQYDKFSILNNRTPNPEYHAVVVPDFVDITYTCMVWTNYMSHMNKLIESFNFASDSYWGEKEKFQFKVAVSAFPIVAELESGKERIIKSEFTFKLQGYIIPNSFNKDMATVVKKFFDKVSIKVGGERQVGGNIIFGDE